MITARSFLIRGLLAGLFAGLVAFGVAYVVGEPSVEAAIAFEEGTGHHHASDAEAAAPHAHPDEGGKTVVPRSVQSTAGLLTATVVAGVTLGGVIGVLSALALGRFGAAGPRTTTLAVTGIGFGSLYVLPFLGYPPNPPAVGEADTIGVRTAVYFALVGVSLVAAVVAVLVGRRMAARWGGWYAGLAALGGYLVVTLVAIAVLPRFDEVPADFPATVLYAFRGASFLTQLTLWTVLGVALAELVGRLDRRAAAGRTTDPYAVSVP